MPASIRRREHRKLVSEALDLLEHPDIRPEAKVGNLGVGAQQLVEVARALVSSARVIVFDEPTSSLSEHDAERLFAIVERLRSRGLAIIYISHFLEEARRVAQTYTVLRDGKAVAAGTIGRNGSEVDHRRDGRARPRRALSPRAAYARRADPRDRPAARRKVGKSR